MALRLRRRKLWKLRKPLYLDPGRGPERVEPTVGLRKGPLGGAADQGSGEGLPFLETLTRP